MTGFDALMWVLAALLCIGGIGFLALAILTVREVAALRRSVLNRRCPSEGD